MNHLYMIGLLIYAGQGTVMGRQSPTVETDLGQVRGVTLTCPHCPRPISAFLGLPYAKPPVEELRFQPPQPPPPWDGIKDATTYGNICLQKPDVINYGYPPSVIPEYVSFSEDCLTVNIYTPDPDASLPVLVWIHGGGFVVGGGILTDGTALASFEDIVVVTFNYRLDILGSISISEDGDLEAGSLSFLDQSQLLRWVQLHIPKFGGNPNKVTIDGESAGGTSVSWHLLSPVSRAMFSGAVVQSSYALQVSSANADQLEDRVRIFAQNTGCVNANLREVAKCLIGSSSDALTKSISELIDVDGWRMFQNPNIVNLNVRQAYQNLTGPKVPIMSGNVACEGYDLGTVLWPALKKDVLKYSFYECSNQIKRYLERYYSLDQLEAVHHAVMDFYFGHDPVMKDKPDFLKKRMADFLGDFMFVSSTYHEASQYALFQFPVYFYEFAHQAYYARRTRPVGMRGSDHYNEIQFFWGFPFLESHSRNETEYREDEEELSRKTMSYLANFVKTGNPNGPNLYEWPPLDPSTQQYLILQNSPFVASQFHKDRVEFWIISVPELLKKLEHSKLHDEL